MAQHLLDAMAFFSGAIVAMAAVAAGGYVWARRRLRRYRRELIGRLNIRDGSATSVLMSLPISRNAIATLLLRRRLHHAVDAATRATIAAERLGVPVGELGSLSIELEREADGIEQLMAHMGPVGVSPEIRGRAQQLVRVAKEIRIESERAASRHASPRHDEVIAAIGSQLAPSTSAPHGFT